MAGLERGGTRPVWRRDGRELFYLDGSNALLAVAMDLSPTPPTWGKAEKLFETKAPGRSAGGPFQYFFSVDRHYDVSADGRRFLLAEQVEIADAAAPGIVVVLDWGAALRAETSRRR